MLTRTTRLLAIALILFGLSAADALSQVAGSHKVTPSERAAALDYWTPERIQNAIPRDLLVADPNAPPADSRPATAREPAVFLPGAPPGASKTSKMKSASSPVRRVGSLEPSGYIYPYPFTRFSVLSALYDESLGSVIFPYSTIGKVFFTLGGQDFVCSAAVARPHLVLTARHCIFDYVHPSGGQFATNVVFNPGWHSGPNTLLGGAWPARTLATWVAGAPDFQFDIGFIQTFDDVGSGCGGSDGFPIESYTGFLGTTWDGDYAQRQWNQLGYPAGPPFDGMIMQETQSSTAAEDQFGFPDTVEVGNDQTGGTSGGPWILGFDPAFASVPPANPGGNFANGVNSFRFVARPLALDSPKFFDYNFNQLRLFAEGIACP